MDIRQSASKLFQSLLLRDNSGAIKEFRRDHLYPYYLLMIAYIYLIYHTYHTAIIPLIKDHKRCDPANRRKLIAVFAAIPLALIALLNGFAPYYATMFIVIGLIMHTIMTAFIYYSIIC